MPILSLLRAAALPLALTASLGCVLLSSACTGAPPPFLLKLREDDVAIDADKARMDDDMQAGNVFRYSKDLRMLSLDLERQEIDGDSEEEDEDISERGDGGRE